MCLTTGDYQNGTGVLLFFGGRGGPYGIHIRYPHKGGPHKGSTVHVYVHTYIHTCRTVTCVRLADSKTPPHQP